MKNFFLCIFFILAGPTFAQVEIDILGSPTGLDPNRNLSTCAECAVSESGCPELYDHIINETLTASLYSMIVGSKMMDTCLAHKNPLNTNINDLNEQLGQSAKHSFRVSIGKLNSCLARKKLSRTREEEVKTIVSYLHGLHIGLDKHQKNKLEAIAEIDLITNNPPLSDINCSVEHSTFCRQLTNCHKGSSIAEVLDLTMTGMHELASLEEQSDLLRKERKIVRGNSFSKEYIVAQKDIDEKIAYVKSLMPWVEGDQLSGHLKNITSLIKEGKTSAARELLQNRLTLQLDKTRANLKSAYIKLKLNQNCLETDRDCTNKAIKGMNQFFAFNESDLDSRVVPSREMRMDVMLAARSAMCLASLKSDKEGMDELNVMVGSTLTGLVSGGFGGVIKLGSVALNFFKGGSALKSIGSSALLGLESKMAIDSFKNVGLHCEQALSNINKVQGNLIQTKTCDATFPQSYNYSLIKSCLTNIATTTIPYALALRGSKKEWAHLQKTTQETIVKMETDEIIKQLTNQAINGNEKIEIAKNLQRLHLSNEELEPILKEINKTVKNDTELNRLKNYINYVSSKTVEEQKMAMNEFGGISLAAKESDMGGHFKKFYEKENKFYLMEKMNQKYYQTKFKQQGQSAEAAEKNAIALAREQRAAFQKKYYSCQSKTITPEHMQAAQRYVGISMALGIGGTTYGHYKANKDLYDESKEQWYAKLGYDITMSILMTKVSSKFIKNNSKGLGSRYIQANLESSMVGGIDAVVYSKLYGVTVEDATLRLEAIKNSPELQKELKALDAFFEQKNVYQLFKSNTVENYKQALNSAKHEEILGKPPYKIGEQEFASLTAADLDNPQIQDALMEALIIQMNSGTDNPLIVTGDKGQDRYINDRVWNAAIGIPKGMVVSYSVYQVLCLGADKPFASLGLASAIQFANQFTFSPLYYEFRKKFIGQ